MLVPDITKAAEWTVEESDKRGPHFVRWRPRPEDVPRNAVSLSVPFPPSAVLGSGDPTLPYPRKKQSPQVKAGGNRQRIKISCPSHAVKRVLAVQL
jgi:hypothetical protein